MTTNERLIADSILEEDFKQLSNLASLIKSSRSQRDLLFEFYHAVDTSNYDEVERLYRLGVNPSGILKVDKPQKFPSCIYSAIAKDDLKMVRQLISYNISLNINPPNSLSPIFVAVLKGNKEIFTELLHAGARLEEPEARGRILITAIRGGNLDIFRIILTHGVQYNKAVRMYGPPVMTCKCCWNKKWYPNQDLNQVPIWLYPLTVCVSYNRIDMVRELLTYDIDINYSTAEVGSALCEAIQLGHDEIADLLLEHKASPLTFKTINHKRYRTLELATERSNPNMVSKLLEALS